MAYKRKSVSKGPYQHRRNRVPTTPDLLFPYLLGPEFVSPPMSSVQTMPVYSTSKSSSSLDNASPFITGYALSTDSIVPPDLSPIPPNYGPSCTESGVVEDFSIRSTTQSIFPPQTDWYGPTGPSTSYMTPVQFDPMISTSRNPHSNTQRPHQDFRLPNYTLDTFLGGFLMSFQAQPSPVVMYKQNFIMPSLG